MILVLRAFSIVKRVDACDKTERGPWQSKYEFNMNSYTDFVVYLAVVSKYIFIE